MRAQVAGGAAPASPLLAAYVEKVRRRAVEITDEEVAALLASGLSEDQVYEATLYAALSAGIERFDIGRRALAEAKR
jgi:hypothetical protein